MTFRSLLVIAIAALAAVPAPAPAQRRQRTTRPRAERIAALPDSARADTLDAALIDSVSLAGYDKPLRSRRESLFVTNRTALRLTRLCLKISYFDAEGRQLHERTVETGTDIPAGATRMVTFPSWDRQQAFVYEGSEKPPRARAIPYTVRVELVRACTAAE